MAIEKTMSRMESEPWKAMAHNVSNEYCKSMVQSSNEDCETMVQSADGAFVCL